ncbi:reticulon-like protein B17 [Cajanus cajan]|uniref:Reticulon-like protein n=1 Tax=Cajanus cajan TaxID=3821 RepID=A0A151SVI4_CAJCA|nr:reticulon-like protein B17 [Cajanus cajan]KYP58804.1 Reticulon-like protein B17 [Cajanus cajan]
MDCFSSPYHHRSRTKSSSRLARRAHNGTVEPLRISLDVVPSPAEAAKPPSPSRSPLSLLRSPTSSLPLRDLLLLSPSSARRSKARFDEEAPEAAGVRRRCKSRAAAQISSPRSSRRWRREEKEAAVDEAVKQKKRRHSGRHRKERLSLVPFQPPSTSSPKTDEENGVDLDRVGALITDLIMWRDVSKSTLWFGLGCLCFLSSSFTKGFNVSIFSAISRLAILLLGVSFFSNSVCQRNQVEKRSYTKLKEDDILHLAKLILPALNFAISKTRELFSGEPCMTLKVAPFLLLGAEYGHLITIWRLSAIGFFVSFSVPKLYSCYSALINQRVECLKLRLLDTWSACTHKKIVVASVLITFWNLSTVKTRIFAAFILLVILRYFRQNVMPHVEDGEAQAAEKEQQQALIVVAEPEEEEPQQALVVAEQQRQC